MIDKAKKQLQDSKFQKYKSDTIKRFQNKANI